MLSAPLPLANKEKSGLVISYGVVFMAASGRNGPRPNAKPLRDFDLVSFRFLESVVPGSSVTLRSLGPA